MIFFLQKTTIRGVLGGLVDRPIHLEDILPRSSGDFVPEGDPELKKPHDPSETSIRRNFRKLCISIRNDPDTPTLDPERDFIDPEKKILVFRMTEVGCLR